MPDYCIYNLLYYTNKIPIPVAAGNQYFLLCCLGCEVYRDIRFNYRSLFFIGEIDEKISKEAIRMGGWYLSANCSFMHL